MKRMIKSLIVAMGLVGCGQEIPTEREVTTKIGSADNIVGAEANRVRKSLSDDGLSSEKVGSAIGKVDNGLGELANMGRKSMSDRGFSSEEILYEISTVDDMIGAEANRVRKDLFERGIREMRYGDQDTTSKVENNSEAIEKNSVRIESLAGLLYLLQLDLADLTNDYLDMVEVFGNDFADLFNTVASLMEQIDTLGSNLSNLTVDSIEGLKEEIERLEGDILAIDPSEFCSVEKVGGVAAITCGESSVSVVDGAKGDTGEQGVPGTNGVDGTQIEVITLCVNSKEVLIKIGPKYVAYYTETSFQDNGNSNDNRDYLSVIDNNGWHRTTDGSNCEFRIHNGLVETR